MTPSNRLGTRGTASGSLALVLAAGLLAGCSRGASRSDCEDACKHLKTMEKRLHARVASSGGVRDLESELKQVEGELARELAKIETELESRIAATGDDDEIDKLKDEYDEKSEALEESFRSRLEEIRERITLAERPGGTSVTDEAGEEATREKLAVADCADECLENDTSARKVQCQLRSLDLASFNSCR